MGCVLNQLAMMLTLDRITRFDTNHYTTKHLMFGHFPLFLWKRIICNATYAVGLHTFQEYTMRMTGSFWDCIVLKLELSDYKKVQAPMSNVVCNISVSLYVIMVGVT